MASFSCCFLSPQLHSGLDTWESGINAKWENDLGKKKENGLGKKKKETSHEGIDIYVDIKEFVCYALN